MVAKKHVPKIIIAVMACAVIACFLAIIFHGELTEALGGTSVRMQYETKLFDTSEIMNVEILMDEDEWNRMLSNAVLEEYYVCDVVINGLKIKNVAIRPKGNTSLSAIAMDPDSTRFSLKLEFDHFVDGQSCYGLDKLILNNNYADATNMKEAIIYDMYQYIGATSSLYNYAKVSVNGEYFGVYLALEGVEQSFMLRNYGTQDGELYKPDSMEMGGGNSSSSGGGFSMSGGGSNLNYSNDELDSYTTIWDGEITSTGKADHKRVVTALKNISEGNDLETYLNVDNVLKYMAVHTFAVNMDSLSGSMAHNYYLYEYMGQLDIFPWDYNLSFGGMSMGAGSASDIVNDAIDTPFSGTKFFDALLSNEEYLEQYHAYLQQLVDEYIGGGRFEETYSRIRSQIDSLVETDPTAFYTCDEYKNAADILHELIQLRGKSIEGQLDGTIPSTDAGQRQDSSALIDASHLDIEAMGQFDMGGGGGGFSFGRSSEKGENAKDGNSESDNAQSGDSQVPEGFDPNNIPEGGNMPDMSQFGGGNMPDMSQFGGGNMPDMSQFGGDQPEDDSEQTGGETPQNMPGNMPSGFSGFSGFSGMPGQTSNQTIKNIVTYAICLVIALAALLIISKTKRRKYRG